MLVLLLAEGGDAIGKCLGAVGAISLIADGGGELVGVARGFLLAMAGAVVLGAEDGVLDA